MYNLYTNYIHRDFNINAFEYFERVLLKYRLSNSNSINGFERLGRTGILRCDNIVNNSSTVRRSITTITAAPNTTHRTVPHHTPYHTISSTRQASSSFSSLLCADPYTMF